MKTINNYQYKELVYEITEIPLYQQDILDIVFRGESLESLKEMPEKLFGHYLTKIREIKDLRNNGPRK